jgi:glycosyltransferase involved in cell wall biosynthesis
MGHDVTVVTTRVDESLPQIEETDGYTVVRLSPGVDILGNDISPSVTRYLFAQTEAFDVMHAHSHLYFVTNMAALRRQLGGPPLAITNHGLFSQSAPERVFRWYLKTLGRWTFNQADVVFCYTQVDKERVRKLGVSSRVEVVSNGIDTERFTPEGPESELIDAEGPVVLFVGRFAEGKRPWLAIEAFVEVLDEYPGAELYLCGDGELRGDLKTQVTELGIEEAVTFLGHVPYEEMPKVYRSGDILILPSRAEGVPRTVLEAMASGTAVVTSQLDQIENIVNSSGQTIEDMSAGSLSDSILNLLDPAGEIEEQAVVNHQWRSTVEDTTAHLESISY